MTFAFFYQYADPGLGVSRNFLCSNVRKVFLANANGYCNQRVDELWAKTGQELNEAKKQELYSEIQRHLTDDVPMGYLLELQFPVVHRKAVRQAITTGIGPNESYDQTYIQK